MDVRVVPAVLGEERWLPLDEKREPINIHPDVREALRSALRQMPERMPELRGMGYSEFIARALRQLGQRIPQGAVPSPPDDDAAYVELHTEEATYRVEVRKDDEGRTHVVFKSDNPPTGLDGELYQFTGRLPQREDLDRPDTPEEAREAARVHGGQDPNEIEG